MSVSQQKISYIDTSSRDSPPPLIPLGACDIGQEYLIMRQFHRHEPIPKSDSSTSKLPRSNSPYKKNHDSLKSIGAREISCNSYLQRLEISQSHQPGNVRDYPPSLYEKEKRFQVDFGNQRRFLIQQKCTRKNCHKSSDIKTYKNMRVDCSQLKCYVNGEDRNHTYLTKEKDLNYSCEVIGTEFSSSTCERNNETKKNTRDHLSNITRTFSLKPSIVSSNARTEIDYKRINSPKPSTNPTSKDIQISSKNSPRCCGGYISEVAISLPQEKLLPSVTRSRESPPPLIPLDVHVKFSDFSALLRRMMMDT